MASTKSSYNKSTSFYRYRTVMHNTINMHYCTSTITNMPLVAHVELFLYCGYLNIQLSSSV